MKKLIPIQQLIPAHGELITTATGTGYAFIAVSGFLNLISNTHFALIHNNLQSS